MKKYLISALLIICTATVQAQDNEKGDLTISSSNANNFYFYLDDVVQNNHWLSRVEMQDVPKGIHKASFRFEDQNVPPLIGSVYVNPNKITYYEVIPNNNGGYYLQVKNFSDKTPGPKHQMEDKRGYNNPPQQADCSGLNEENFKAAYDIIKAKPFDDVRLTVAKEISSNNILSAAQITRLCRLFNFDDSRLDYAKYAYDRCCDKNMYYLVNAAFKFSNTATDLAHYIAAQPAPATRSENGHDYKDRVFNDDREVTHDYQQNNSGCLPMEANAFQQAGQTISSKSFDDTRLELAKSVAQSNCLYADQIYTICKYFSFEATKLEFAKFAYSHCYDKANYFKVNDVFDFESSVKELTDYINNK